MTAPIVKLCFLVGGCGRSPLVGYVNVTVNRGDTSTEQAEAEYVLATPTHEVSVSFWAPNS